MIKLKYNEFDHPIIRGILELYRGSTAWSMIGITVVYIGLIIAVLCYIYIRRHQMTRRRWIYAIGSFIVMTVLFLSSIIIPGHLKSGYYAGDVDVQKVVPITDTGGRQYGIIPRYPIQPKQIKGLVLDKKIVKDKKIKDGDTLRIKTNARYVPKKTMTYVMIESSDIKDVKRGK